MEDLHSNNCDRENTETGKMHFQKQ